MEIRPLTIYHFTRTSAITAENAPLLSPQNFLTCLSLQPEIKEKKFQRSVFPSCKKSKLSLSRLETGYSQSSTTTYRTLVHSASNYLGIDKYKLYLQSTINQIKPPCVIERLGDFYKKELSDLKLLLKNPDIQDHYLFSIKLKELRFAIFHKYFQEKIIPEILALADIQESDLFIIGFNSVMSQKRSYGCSLGSDIDTNIILSQRVPLLAKKQVENILRKHKSILMQNFETQFELGPFTVRKIDEILSLKDSSAKNFYRSIQDRYVSIYPNKDIEKILFSEQMSKVTPSQAFVQLRLKPLERKRSFSLFHLDKQSPITREIGSKLCSKDNWSMNLKDFRRIFEYLLTYQTASSDQELILLAGALNSFFRSLETKIIQEDKKADYTILSMEQFVSFMQDPIFRNQIHALLEVLLPIKQAPRIIQKLEFFNILLQNQNYKHYGYEWFSEVERKFRSKSMYHYKIRDIKK